MLVVDGYNGQAFFVSDVTGEWLEVGNDKVDLAFVDQVPEPGKTLRRLRHGDQVLGDGSLVTHSVIHVSKAEAEDLGDVEMLFQIAQSAIKRGHVDIVSLSHEMGELPWRGSSAQRPPR